MSIAYSGPEVSALAAILDRAIARLIEQPWSADDLVDDLRVALSHLRELSAIPDGIALRMFRLNLLFSGANRFYETWSALAGIAECDRAQRSFSLRG